MAGSDSSSKPKSDAFTVAVHSGLLAAMTVSLVTGPRIAADMPQDRLAGTVRGVLPLGNVIDWHHVTALAFDASCVAKAVYI